MSPVFSGQIGKETLAVCVLLLTTLVLHGAALDGNWRWDDPQILLHAHQYSILQDYVDPTIWQQFSPANLTPWLIFSFEVDLTLFGAAPFAFYLHQVLALAAAAVGLYACLRLWAGQRAALAGGFLFLAGAPVWLVAEQLMTRHYIEGLVFAELALIGFVCYLRTGNVSWLLAGVLGYLLAVTAKEVYVPLVILLPFIQEKSISARTRAVIPYVVVAVLYVLWRGWMLGTVSGGYVESSSYLTMGFMLTVAESFLQFPALLLGNGWWLGLILAVLLLVMSVRHNRSGFLPGCIAVLLVLLPLVPLVVSPGIVSPDRYLFLLWAVLVFLVMILADRLYRNRVMTGLSLLMVFAVFCGLTLLQSLQQRNLTATVGEEFDVQAAFLWQHDESAAFLPSANVLPSFWFVTGLQAFKTSAMPDSSAPKAIVDMIYLESDDDVLYSYDSTCRCMQDISGTLASRQAEFRAALHPLAPLELRFSYQSGVFTWEFGPYDEGIYYLVSDVIGVIPAPRTGRMRVSLAENAPFYLRYDSPVGWTSYSTQQHIRHNAAEVSWTR